MVKVICVKHTCEGCYIKKKKCSGIFPCISCVSRKELCKEHQRSRIIFPKIQLIVKPPGPIKLREIKIDYSQELKKMQLKLDELETKLKLTQMLKIQVFRVKPTPIVNNLIKLKV